MSDVDIKDTAVPRGILEGRRVRLRPFSASAITAAASLGWLYDPEVEWLSNQSFRSHTTETCRAYLTSSSGSVNHFSAICGQCELRYG